MYIDIFWGEKKENGLKHLSEIIDGLTSQKTELDISMDEKHGNRYSVEFSTELIRGDIFLTLIRNNCLNISRVIELENEVYSVCDLF